MSELVRGLVIVLVLGQAGCARRLSPEETIDAYRAALTEGNLARLRDLSDLSFRDRYDETALRRWLRKNPRLIDEAEERLREPPKATEVAIRTDEGDLITLVREGDAWRVAEGGLLVARFDTPEAALRTFFFAATGHIGLLRQLIPDALVDRYASDYALGSHLYSIQDRIFQAQSELGPITGERVEIRGAHAFIAYGQGKSVEMVREDGRWRIVDVE